MVAVNSLKMILLSFERVTENIYNLAKKTSLTTFKKYILNRMSVAN